MVVGSEIFNLLIIVGLTISAAPVVPLALERVPFARDCFFYALSIALLYWALLDHAIATGTRSGTLSGDKTKCPLLAYKKLIAAASRWRFYSTQRKDPEAKHISIIGRIMRCFLFLEVVELCEAVLGRG